MLSAIGSKCYWTSHWTNIVIATNPENRVPIAVKGRTVGQKEHQLWINKLGLKSPKSYVTSSKVFHIVLRIQRDCRKLLTLNVAHSELTTKVLDVCMCGSLLLASWGLGISPLNFLYLAYIWQVVTAYLIFVELNKPIAVSSDLGFKFINY